MDTNLVGNPLGTADTTPRNLRKSADLTASFVFFVVESVCAPKKLRDFKNSAKKSSREPARFRATVDSNVRTIWIADAHRGDRKPVRCAGPMKS
jgi:hypothetical protein